MTDPAAVERAVGALVGSVVGDALGAPFEFGPPDQFTRAFPEPRLLEPTEMTGGGPWAPAEWTDDTQMALLLAQSLLERGGLDEADVFDRFRQWADGGPKDIGIQTRQVLAPGSDWRYSAADHFAATGHAAGNGSLMRTTPAAIWFAGAGRTATMDAARRISALTHGDPAAGEGCAIFHELIRVALAGEDSLDQALLDELVDLVPIELRDAWAVRLEPGYAPQDDWISNGAVWPALGAAIWAIRTTDSFADALIAAIDLGDDTDTVACITGGLAGARYGIGAIPSRWTTGLAGNLIGNRRSDLGLDDLEVMAADLLAGVRSQPGRQPDETPILPTLAWPDDLVYAANLMGVSEAIDSGQMPEDALVISLSRTFGQLEAWPSRRQVWMIDQPGDDRNLAIQLVLDDVLDTIDAAVTARRPVVVHCHDGRSRTGLVLQAWLLRKRPDLTVAEVAERWPHLDTGNSSFQDALAARVERN